MKALETWMLTYLLNSLWQVPLVFAAAWIAARAVRRSIAFEHGIWVSALIISVVLPACSFHPAELLVQLWQLVSHWNNAATGEVRVTVTPGIALQHGALRLPLALLAAIAMFYAGSIFYFAARLAWGLVKTNTIRKESSPAVFTGNAAATWTRCRRIFGVDEAQAACSREVNGPMTIGIRHRLLLLPEGWPATLPAEDLAAAIAHEFAHMHRRDFAKNLACELLSLPIAYHPLLWLMRSRIAETREMICDAMAADAVAGREEYARSLLRLAATLNDRSPVRTLHAIGIFDANIFERRVMNLTTKQMEFRGARRWATAAACLVLGLGTCASALALRMEISAPEPTPQQGPAAETPSHVHISSGVMAGMLLTHVNPTYPQEAREAHISGSVILHAIIGKDGTIESLHVVSGPKELTGASLEAVKQWTYKPYLLNGNPVEVDTTITVNYSLNQ